MFGFFKKQKKGSINNIREIIDEYGLEAASIYLSIPVMAAFSKDPSRGIQERRQFLREEADAASRGDSSAKRFATTLFANPAEYRGAMVEEADYPIDGPDGPQQTLLKIILALRSEPELMVKLRCAIVGYISGFHQAELEALATQSTQPMENFLERHRNLRPVFEKIHARYDA